MRDPVKRLEDLHGVGRVRVWHVAVGVAKVLHRAGVPGSVVEAVYRFGRWIAFRL